MVCKKAFLVCTETDLRNTVAGTQSRMIKRLQMIRDHAGAALEQPSPLCHVVSQAEYDTQRPLEV